MGYVSFLEGRSPLWEKLTANHGRCPAEFSLHKETKAEPIVCWKVIFILRVASLKSENKNAEKKETRFKTRTDASMSHVYHLGIYWGQRFCCCFFVKKKMLGIFFHKNLDPFKKSMPIRAELPILILQHHDLRLSHSSFAKTTPFLPNSGAWITWLVNLPPPGHVPPPEIAGLMIRAY